MQSRCKSNYNNSILSGTSHNHILSNGTQMLTHTTIADIRTSVKQKHRKEESRIFYLPAHTYVLIMVEEKNAHQKLNIWYNILEFSMIIKLAPLPPIFLNDYFLLTHLKRLWTKSTLRKNYSLQLSNDTRQERIKCFRFIDSLHQTTWQLQHE